MTEHLIIILVLISAIPTLAIGVYTFHKVRNMHLMLFEMTRKMNVLETYQRKNSRLLMDSLFRQLESLVSLYVDLGLRKSLPRMRNWAASPDFLRELASHALSDRPEVIVECGSGVSTIVLARCLSLNERGHLYSLEHDVAYSQQTRKELDRHGLKEWATVLDSPIEDIKIGDVNWKWYSPQDLPPAQIDMLVIDGPPGDLGTYARYPAGPRLFPSLAADATVFADDLIRDDERKIFDRWLHEFPFLVGEIKPFEKQCGILRKR